MTPKVIQVIQSETIRGDGRATIMRAVAPGGSELDKLEITPEMYRAASRALEPFYLGEGVYDLQEDALAAIYLAMTREARAAAAR